MLDQEHLLGQLVIVNQKMLKQSPHIITYMGMKILSKKNIIKD